MLFLICPTRRMVMSAGLMLVGLPLPVPFYGLAPKVGMKEALGFDAKALFSEPVALTDLSGRPVVTGKSQGCPFAADYNDDGKIDIVLGAKEDMQTATGGVWLIPNSGTAEKPAFSWPDAVRVRTKEGAVKIVRL